MEQDYDVYLVFMQIPCDDPYYTPSVHLTRIYRSKEKAIEKAKKSFESNIEECKKYNSAT